MGRKRAEMITMCTQRKLSTILKTKCNQGRLICVIKDVRERKKDHFLLDARTEFLFTRREP
jgi:hypothetical protein